MEICLLGSLEVLDDDGKALAVSGPRLQTLLTALALRCGEVVNDDHLVDALWAGNAPNRSANALQRQVSTLRRALGAPDFVERRVNGYLLTIDRMSVDVFQFDALATRGQEAMRAGDAARARELLEEALRLWRGDALAHVAYAEFAQPEIARLNEARLVATEVRIDADLDLGRERGLIAELEQLVSAYPLREHLRAQLMLALSRAGRPAEALRAYQSVRTVLGEELGLEPSTELRALEAAILRQEEAVVRRDAETPSARPKTNLRTPLTTMIGRRHDLDTLRPVLEERRLVTLVGPGGVGKSRLALEAARECFAPGEIEVWIIELADVTDVDDVVPAIMAALELPRVGRAHADARRLIEYLRDRRALLVFDNCEHLVASAARVAQEVLESCPMLRIWVTSREGLAVPGEVLWAVPPLGLDDAVELFVERGRAADPTWDVAVESQETRKGLAEICARLDGLPLAIELAAARLRAMSIADLAAGLEDRFRMLNRGARTALPRQQTMRAVVDWSYDLLFDDERRVFERLSVFRGSCALAAARVVCAGADISGDDVAELVARLVDKSLVVVERDEVEGYGRCRMLQTLVDYGRDRLEESGDADRVHHAHIRYYSDFSLRSLAALRGEKQRGWLRAVTANLVNLRAAFDGAVAEGDAETAHCIAGGLGWFWWFTGRAPEGAQWLMQARSCPGPVRNITRARVLAWTTFAAAPGFVRWTDANQSRPKDDPSQGVRLSVAEMDELGREAIALYGESAAAREELAGVEMALSVTYSTLGNFARAGELLTDAELLLDSVAGDPEVAAMQAFVAGRRAFVEDRYGDAEDSFRISIELLAACEVDVHCSFALRYAARLAALRGDQAAAIEALERALDLVRSLGLSGFANILLTDLGVSLGAKGDVARARAVLDQPLTAAREVGSLAGISESLTALAIVEWQANEAERATSCAQEALAIARQIDHYEAAAYCLVVLGFTAARLGRKDAARPRYTEALEFASLASAPRGIAFALEGLADLARLDQDAYEIARLLGEAAAFRSSPGRAAGLAFAASTRFDTDQHLAAATQTLGRDVASRAFAEGAARAEAASLVSSTPMHE